MRQEAFEQHPVWQSLNALQSAVDEADKREEAAAADPLNAVRYLVGLVRSHEAPSDPAPYSSPSLQAVNAHLASITTEVSNYASNGNVAHLQNAENYADQALHGLGTWPTALLRGGAATQASKVFSEYRDDATEAIRVLRESNEKLRAALGERTTEMTALSAKITQDEARLDQALITTNEAFVKAQADRQKEYSEWLEKESEVLDAKAMSDLSEVTTMRRRASERLEEIDALHVSVEKVSSKAAAAILAKDYGAYSTREWVSGVIAYVAGFGLLVALAGYLLFTVGDVARDEQVSWQYVALKLGLTLSAIAASGVAFQFGSHALTRASTNKRVQLELATIGTFLADVGDEAAVQQAKVNFVNRMFGRAWEPQASEKRSDDSVNAAALTKIVDSVQRLQGGS